jgi:hypothetical protein
VAAVAQGQDARVVEALQHIPDTGAKLLALHAYLRAGPALAQRWSWSPAQISQFHGSAHEQQLEAAVRAVSEAFERNNPGYTLTVNPQVRSLDRQIASWNSNATVASAAREFAAAAAEELGQPAAGGMDATRFARFVAAHIPRPSPTLAAPGLSRHGQMYAVDFHVRDATAVVADTDAASIARVWEGQGWERRVRAAVSASGAAFAGPLQNPHEPWHYDYQPPAATD